MRSILVVTIVLVSLAAAAILGIGAGRSEGDAAAPIPGVDFIRVDKSERRLELWYQGAMVKTYEIALGRDPIGPKRREGDGKTPEGDYIVSDRNPRSAYHLSLRISYPSAADRALSAVLGFDPGGDIFIHGLPNGWPTDRAPKIDWTAGCIALDNDEIEELWRVVKIGTPIRIDP